MRKGDGAGKISIGQAAGNLRKITGLKVQKRRASLRAPKRGMKRGIKRPVAPCHIHTTTCITFMNLEQQGKPSAFPRVLSLVDRINPSEEATVNAPTRRFVKVAPPTMHAGVGNALRQAFAMDNEVRSLTEFDDLLSRLG
jgi:hypothetical protein